MKALRALAAFSGRQDGGVAIIFGLSILVLGLAAGLAIDYARAFSIETSLRADLDAAVLGAASSISDPSAIQARALSFFDDNWKRKHAVSDVVLNVTQTDHTKLTGTATATMPTTLMRLGGFETMTLSATSEVEVAGGNVELSLVLDTTASMAGSKLDGLKEAAKSLIKTAYEAPDADQHVKIGIVPFGQYVNVGLANRTKSWMSVPSDSSTPKQWCDTYGDETGTSNCRMETINATNDGVPYSYQQEVCDHSYGPPSYRCTDYTEVMTWNGCVGSRDNPLDTLDEQYSTPVPGVMNASCGSEITPLSNDKVTLDGQIDALAASGDTYIPTGLMWGWSVLSKAEPFDEAVDYGARVDGKPVRKVMVLMTDGFNTLSPIYPEHTGNDTMQANTITAGLCTNIKGQDIDIYTVAFQVSDNSIKDILETCASSSSKFFDATDSDELVAAFRNIARDFTPLRLAR